jgi:GLPGLI family protein
MKNKIQVSILLVIFLLTLKTVELKAQNAEGTIRYLCTRNWAKMMSTVDYLSKNQRDRMMYMWGNRSEWKTYSHLHFSPTESKYEDSEEEAEPGSEGWSNRKETFFMKRNFQKNTLYDGITMMGKTYLIHDTITPLKWKIMNDLKEVAGHICMNASLNDTMRKQNVIVWFALDMPNNSGPDRFIGLPGMVLEVDINDGAFVMTADKIDLAPLTTELEVPAKIKGKKINMAEYNKLFEKQVAESKANEQPWFWGMRY